MVADAGFCCFAPARHHAQHLRACSCQPTRRTHVTVLGVDCSICNVRLLPSLHLATADGGQHVSMAEGQSIVDSELQQKLDVFESTASEQSFLTLPSCLNKSRFWVWRVLNSRPAAAEKRHVWYMLWDLSKLFSLLGSRRWMPCDVPRLPWWLSYLLYFRLSPASRSLALFQLLFCCSVLSCSLDTLMQGRRNHDDSVFVICRYIWISMLLCRAEGLTACLCYCLAIMVLHEEMQALQELCPKQSGTFYQWWPITFWHNVDWTTSRIFSCFSTVSSKNSDGTRMHNQWHLWPTVLAS